MVTTVPVAADRARATLLAIIMLFIVGLGAGPATASFPRDEGPHGSSHEWWSYTGPLQVADASGRAHSYGFELTFFSKGARPRTHLAAGRAPSTRGFDKRATRLSLLAHAN